LIRTLEKKKNTNILDRTNVHKGAGDVPVQTSYINGSGKKKKAFL